MVSFSDLPTELLIPIFLLIELPDVLRLRGLSKCVNQIIASKHFAYASLAESYDSLEKRQVIKSEDQLVHMFFSVSSTPPDAFREVIAEAYWKDTITMEVDVEKVIGSRLARYSRRRKKRSSYPFRFEFPVALSLIKNLTQLNLMGIDGPVPHQIGELKELTHLTLSKGKNKGMIPNELGKLVKLRHLSLSNMAVSGSFPEFICGLINLEHLNLSANFLEGNISALICDLVNLDTLDLSDNALQGCLPQGLSKLQKLRSLHFFKNKLTGPIPKEIGSLKQLKFLDLSYNQFSGPIPDELGDLPNLFSLMLGYNQLIGPIPEKIVHLEQLKAMSICLDQLAYPFTQRFVDRIYSQEVCCKINGEYFYLEERKVPGANTTAFFALMEPCLSKPQGHVYRLN